MRAYSFILTCVVLAGCTSKQAVQGTAASEPTPRQAETARPARAETDTRAAIVVLGNSLAEGLGVQAGQGFPEVLQTTLDRQGYSYRVVNLGISGDTTTGGLGRLRQALALRPEILILELGGNDGLRGVPVSSTKANLEKIIIAAKSAGAQVLLAGMSLPPNYGPDYIRSFEDAYKDLARKHKVPLIPFLLEQIAAELNSRPGLMQRDGIHPSAEGHQLIAGTVFRYLRPMLRPASSAAGAGQDRS